MNTKNLKAYAPKARAQFIDAIKKRAAQLGIYEDKIAEVLLEGGAAIIEGRVFTKKQGQQRQQLERKINGRSEVTHTERYNLFIREMAYTWFNRLAAIRYMELHDYFDHGFRVLSAAKNHSSSQSSSQNQLPEILDNASDVADSLALNKSDIIELQLAGNKEEELYRELLLGQCHYLYRVMPFMFEQLDDATELLLPDNLTKTDSILKGLVNEIPEEDWNEIEVIGWLYQFYISEHKDAVIGKVVKSEDIPAATQLFTPNWIVKYLVQNSLGRQWLATYPESELKGKMEYYIEPAEQSDDVLEQLKAITPTSIDPETIKVLDPAAGSGHILVEIYEVLREIYLERGYRLREIPELILTKNIYGLDIDDRAAQLAGFALIMKAREDDRRIFDRIERGEVTLNVFSLQSSENLNIDKLWQALNLEGNQQTGSTGGLLDDLEDELQNQSDNSDNNNVGRASARQSDNSNNNNVGRALARQNDTDDQCDGLKPNLQSKNIYTQYFELLQTLKTAFLQAKTLGSLIQIDNQHLQSLIALKELLQVKEKGSDPSAKQAANDIFPIVSQAVVLAQEYDVVVANPPYMGNSGMNSVLKENVQSLFPNSKSDLFSIYIEKCLEFATENGSVGLVTPYVWMFLSSYEKLREKLVSSHTISSLVQLEYNAFAPACIPVCTYVLAKTHIPSHKGNYIRLSDFKGHEIQAPKTLEAIKNKDCGWYYESNQENYKLVKGAPIAYWVSEKLISLFANFSPLTKYGKFVRGMASGDNNKFIRFWHEVSLDDISAGKTWAPYNKGGNYRRWFGNNSFVIKWESDGHEIKNFKDEKGKLRSRPQNTDLFFKPSLSYGSLTSSTPSIRFYDSNAHDQAGNFLPLDCVDSIKSIAGFLNSKVALNALEFLSPTLNILTDDFNRLPFPHKLSINAQKTVTSLIDIAKQDWDFFERSLDYSGSPLLQFESSGKIKSAFDLMQTRNYELVKKFNQLETENNSLFINGLDLSSLYEPGFSSKDLTLDINPSYRYKENEYNSIGSIRVLSDTMSELTSYSLGCMMGRYSLDREGLVYAHSANEGFKNLVSEEAYQTFPADDDGIVPLASEDWLFDDDATARFREFVKTVWGEAHLQENLEFVAESLCLHALKPVKGESATDTVRRYFSKQFYKDHCKTYKKRPIYWLFSSGKEKAFECLVYLHRYNEGTLARMRTEYVTPLMGKYDQQQSMLSEQIIEASNTEKRQIEKDLKSLEKKQAELSTFDEQLKHYAEMRITLDLDDGVKANYGKFGNLLADVKAIHGKLPEKTG